MAGEFAVGRAVGRVAFGRDILHPRHATIADLLADRARRNTAVSMHPNTLSEPVDLLAAKTIHGVESDVEFRLASSEWLIELL